MPKPPARYTAGQFGSNQLICDTNAHIEKRIWKRKTSANVIMEWANSRASKANIERIHILEAGRKLIGEPVDA